MFCSNCGRELYPGATACLCGATVCQTTVQDRATAPTYQQPFQYSQPNQYAPPQPYSGPVPGSQYSMPGAGYAPNMTCPRCGSIMNVQVTQESRKTGCGTVLLYILLALTILGLLIVIPLMLRKKTETVSYAVCQRCGYRVRV